MYKMFPKLIFKCMFKANISYIFRMTSSAIPFINLKDDPDFKMGLYDFL